ncbi:hypothetical protein AAG570_006879 [Ranatra chinensis]|uniref:Uncharacterized protein n=1 Tax=Ranatra chinensis TaxID=642074 RepID=A0ABD0Z5W0_9HEMI
MFHKNKTQETTENGNNISSFRLGAGREAMGGGWAVGARAVRGRLSSTTRGAAYKCTSGPPPDTQLLDRRSGITAQVYGYVADPVREEEEAASQRGGGGSGGASGISRRRRPRPCEAPCPALGRPRVGPFCPPGPSPDLMF